jgi:hypothetical protein
MIEAGDEDVFPQLIFDENVSGWLYLNLDDFMDEEERGAQQSWVVVHMQAEGRYSVAFDAAWLGNGCSPIEVSDFTDNYDWEGGMPGPADDVNP